MINALQLSVDSLTVATRTKKDLMHVLSKCREAVIELGYEQLLIKDVSRKHLKNLLNVISKTNDRYNKNRSYLMIMFGELLEREMVSANFPRDLKKKKVLRQVRLTLTQEERIRVNDYLKETHKEFHRFLHIFFHSGARISELLRLKTEDIDITNQKFRIVILKGSQYKEEWKTIKDVSLSFWQELVIRASRGEFVFSKGLKPGSIEIQPYQIGKRWYRLVKKRLNIKADFYSLKHLHTTEVAETIGSVEAAKHNSHTSTDMVNKIYDTTLKHRKQGQIKTLNNPFA